MGSDPVSDKHLFFEQEALHYLLTTGWSQEQIGVCVYSLIVSYTIKRK